jgi:hypothetical protein
MFTFVRNLPHRPQSRNVVLLAVATVAGVSYIRDGELKQDAIDKLGPTIPTFDRVWETPKDIRFYYSNNGKLAFEYVHSQVHSIDYSKSYRAPIVTLATTDPAVTIWQKDNRMIYLVGCSFISPFSAALVKQVVLDVKPHAIFLELCPPKWDATLPLVKNYRETKYSYAELLTKTDQELLIPINQKILTVKEYASAGSVTEEMGRIFTVGYLGQNLSHVDQNYLREQDVQRKGYQVNGYKLMAIKYGQQVNCDFVAGDLDYWLFKVRRDLATQADGLRAHKRASKEQVPNEMEKEKLYLKQSGRVDRELMDTSEFLKKRVPYFYRVTYLEKENYLSAGMNAMQQYPVMVAPIDMAHQTGIEAKLMEKGWSRVQVTLDREQAIQESLVALQSSEQTKKSGVWGWWPLLGSKQSSIRQ